MALEDLLAKKREEEKSQASKNNKTIKKNILKEIATHPKSTNTTTKSISFSS